MFRMKELDCLIAIVADEVNVAEGPWAFRFHRILIMRIPDQGIGSSKC